MEKTLTSIQIDFNRAMKQADRLDDLAYELTGLAQNQINGAMQEIHYSWTGEAAEQYLKKGQIIEEKVIQSASQLKKIAAVIRTTATVTYNAELEAIRIAQIREY